MHTAMPPIITDMINKILDDKISSNEKNNIASTLEIIGMSCTKAAQNWRDKFNKRENIQKLARGNKMRVRS